MSLQTTFISVVEPIASTNNKLVKHSEFSYGCRYLAHKLEESLKQVKLEKEIVTRSIIFFFHHLV